MIKSKSKEEFYINLALVILAASGVYFEGTWSVVVCVLLISFIIIVVLLAIVLLFGIFVGAMSSNSALAAALDIPYIPIASVFQSSPAPFAPVIPVAPASASASAPAPAPGNLSNLKLFNQAYSFDDPSRAHEIWLGLSSNEKEIIVSFNPEAADIMQQIDDQMKLVELEIAREKIDMQIRQIHQ